MNRLHLIYSNKNIPIPNRFEYKKQFMEKTEDLIKRMRWRAFHFLNPSNKENINTFGFRTTNHPPKIPEMKQFEEEIFNIMNKIEYRKIASTFQNKLSEDIETINNCDDVIVKADKTSNLYKIKVQDYEKLMQDNITKSFLFQQKYTTLCN